MLQPIESVQTYWSDGLDKPFPLPDFSRVDMEKGLEGLTPWPRFEQSFSFLSLQQ